MSWRITIVSEANVSPRPSVPATVSRARRYEAGGAAALGCAAVSVLFAVPAQACSCVQGSAQEAVDRGGTVVIVTRTDDTPNDGRGRGGPPVGTFRVKDFIGPEPPAELHGPLDTGASCAPYVAPGALAALSAGRGKDGEWTVGGCGSGYPIGPALQLAEGDPDSGEGGPAVAYAAGDFGTGRLAALDQDGRVVAWDRTPGRGTAVAVCPGSETLAAVGEAPLRRKPGAKADFTRLEPGPNEVTIHDAADLDLQRTITLGTASGEDVVALRCLDPAGELVDLVARYHGEREYDSRLVRVRDGKVTSVPLGAVSDAQAIADGFMVRDEGRDRTSFSRLGSDGRQTPVAQVDAGIEAWQVSPDGRTIAAYSYLGKKLRNTIVTLDVASGERLGKSPDRDYVTGLAWTASGELLARESKTYRQHPNRVFAFDRSLAERGEWPAVPSEWAGRFGALGHAAIVYGSGTPLTATLRAGSPLVADSKRLASATHVVPASDEAEFAVGPAGEQSADGLEVIVDDASGDPGLGTDTIATVAGTGAAAGLLAAVFAVRRRAQRAS